MKPIFALLAAGAAIAVTLAPAHAAKSHSSPMVTTVAEHVVITHTALAASIHRSDDETGTEHRRHSRHKRISRHQHDERSASKRHKHSASRRHSGSDDDGDRGDRGRRHSHSGGSVDWTADEGCLDSTLRHVITSLASSYGSVTVNSTCRSPSHNASVGGAPKSYHLKGEAVDFRVHSNISAAYASLRDNGNVGGLKHYGGGLFHIDTGPRRSW